MGVFGASRTATMRTVGDGVAFVTKVSAVSDSRVVTVLQTAAIFFGTTFFTTTRSVARIGSV